MQISTAPSSESRGWVLTKSQTTANVLNRRTILVTEGGTIVKELKTGDMCAFACMLHAGLP